MSRPAVLALSGSPSAVSRTAAVLDQLIGRLSDRHGLVVPVLAIRDLPPAALVHADLTDPRLAAAVEAICSARGIIVATPIYQAAYSGLLKTMLDLLPKQALAGKVILPLATAGSAAHLLALDYSLRPVLAVLGAERILAGRTLLTGAVDREALLTVESAADALAAAIDHDRDPALGGSMTAVAPAG